MSDPTIAFLRQPLEILARGGAAVTGPVIKTLSEWVTSDRIDHVVSRAHDRIYVLAAPATAWHVVLLTRGGHRHGAIEVAAVDDARAVDLMAYYEPLVDLEHLTSMMEVKFKKLDARIVTLAAETLDLGAPHYRNAPYGADRARGMKPLLMPHPRSESADFLRAIDDSADRWASSKARSNFKGLLDGARERPQVVERDGDDVVIVSRRYLQEAVDPTSAKGLSRRYLEMALSDADMPVLEQGPLPPLDDLPQIGPA